MLHLLYSIHYILRIQKVNTFAQINTNCIKIHFSIQISTRKKPAITNSESTARMCNHGTLTKYKLLVDYYETDDCGKIKAFLHENAIQGMTISQEHKRKYSNGNDMNMS